MDAKAHMKLYKNDEEIIEELDKLRNDVVVRVWVSRSQSKSEKSQPKSEKKPYLILRTFQTLSYFISSHLKIFSNIKTSQELPKHY